MFEDLPDSGIPDAVLPDLMTQSAQLTRLSGKTAYVTAPESATSTLPNNKYGRLSGTSIATPYVALMLSANPNLTDAKIRELLTGVTVR